MTFEFVSTYQRHQLDVSDIFLYYQSSKTSSEYLLVLKYDQTENLLDSKSSVAADLENIIM